MSNIIRFGGYEIDLATGQLRKRGVRIRLGDQCFRVLGALLEHPGEVVSREALRQRIWGDEVFVDFENNLNTTVARLREALCDSAEHPRFIETIPKHGYRFMAAVHRNDAADSRRHRRVKLMVLPFVNLSGDSSQDYFSDAMTDELITELATLAPEQIAVIARTTAMHYKGTQEDVSTISGQIGVDFVVEGGVRRNGTQVDINVQLIQSSDQTHLFASKYQTERDDLFSTESLIAADIAEHLPSLSPDLRRKFSAGRKHAPTRSITAYDEYIRARYFMDKVTVESYAIAKRHLENATALDSEFAAAFDALAEICWFSGYLGFISPRKAFSTGIVYALRALEIDNARAETHALLGQFHKTVEYNWAEVDREMALAIQLNPNSALVRMRYAASGLMPHGRVQEAAAELKRALELDPLATMARFWLCVMLMLNRQHDEAIAQCKSLLADEPSAFGAYFIMAACFRYRKLFQEAIAAQRKAVEISGGAATMMGALGLALAEGGKVAEAREVLRKLHEMAKQMYVAPFSFVFVHIGLQEIDAAFEWLDRAVEECDQFTMPIKTYGFLDPLREDPRFSVLLHKMNLRP